MRTRFLVHVACKLDKEVFCNKKSLKGGERDGFPYARDAEP